jgi:multiple sugar transport system permease protein
MPNKSFFWFFLPTGLAMILFIGLPIISTGVQSFYAQHDQILKEVKKCDPFGCKFRYKLIKKHLLKLGKKSHLENLMVLELM